MIRKSEVSSDSKARLGLEKCRESIAHPSGAILKASLIAPRDIIDALPEVLLRWLHEDLDRECASEAISRRQSKVDFESVVVDRLFPLRDNRSFILRLRRHSQATAVAAGLLADFTSGPATIASVCGWLHDLGIAACIRHIDEVSYLSDDAALEVLWSTVVRSSTQHGIRLASRWRLPSAVRHALREHASLLTCVHANRTAAATLVAEHVAAIVGYEFHEPTPEDALSRAVTVLGCSERDVLAVAARTDRIMREMASGEVTLRRSEGA